MAWKQAVQTRNESTAPTGKRARFPKPETMLSRLQTAFGNLNVMLLFDPAVCRSEDTCCSGCESGGGCAAEDSASGDLRAAALARVAPSIADAGQPLTAHVQSLMNSRFAHDFSDVRLHVGDAAATAARAMNARAFTVGRNIVFGEGAYAPSENAGLRVLAHELAHVVQQDHAPRSLARDVRVSEPNDRCEHEAERAADDVMAGRTPRVSAVEAAPIARQVLVEQPAAGCGVCQGPQTAGDVAHALVQMDFQSSHPLGLEELHFAGPGGRGFLDLAIATPQGLQIGEIKPAHTAGYAEGESDMLFYLSAVAAAFPGTTVTPLDFTLSPWVTIFPNPNAAGGCPTQSLYVNPPINGVYGYWCDPPFKDLVRNPNCKCQDDDGHRVEQTVRAPGRERNRDSSALGRVAQFVEELIAGGVTDIEAAARKFLQDNPDLVTFLVGGAILLIAGMIVQDILTAGAGLADNPLIIAIVTTLIRVAQQFQPAQ